MGKHRIKDESENEEDVENKLITADEIDINKREILIKASEENFITQKVEYLKKCSDKVINKLYKSYELKRKKKLIYS